jgi:hypothetical protein
LRGYSLYVCFSRKHKPFGMFGGVCGYARSFDAVRFERVTAG